MIGAEEFIEVFIPLFIIINPLAIFPNFEEITNQMDKNFVSKLSTRTTISAFLLLALFILIGRPFLNIIGVSTSAFMIACGVLLLYISLGMLSGNPPVTRNVEFDKDSIVPMSIPLLAGPGSIATVIVFEESYGKPLVFLSLVLCVVISKLMLQYYIPISKMLGKNGINAWIRLSAMFFAAISVSLITQGILLIW